MEVDVMDEIPMCYCFDPTDEELLLPHLKNKVEGRPLTVPIPTVNVYDLDPWSLPLEFKGGKGFFYCFTQLHRCSEKGRRIKRSVGCSGGTWFTNNTRVITVGGEVVGHRSFLSFQVMKKSTGWVMYEYRLKDDQYGDSSSSSSKRQELVICKIKNGSKLEGCGKRKTREGDDDQPRCGCGSSNIDHPVQYQCGSSLQPTTSPDQSPHVMEQPLFVDGRSGGGSSSSSNGDHPPVDGSSLHPSTSTDQSLVTVDQGVLIMEEESFPCEEGPDPWDGIDDQIWFSLEELLGEGEGSGDHDVGSSLPGERTDQRSSTDDGPMQLPESTGQTPVMGRPVVVDGRSEQSKVWRRLTQCMRTMGTPVEETTVEMIPGPQWYYEDLHRQLLRR